MRTFRLKYLFCLVLVVSVALMWWKWWSSYSVETANRLLILKQRISDGDLDFFETQQRFHDYMGATSPPRRWRRQLNLWMGCSVIVQFSNAGDRVTKFKWQADWPAIEAKASEEDWSYYRHVTITVVAGLFAGRLVWPRKESLLGCG